MAGGFPTAGIGTHFGDTSVVEDVTDIIYQITPEDTPFWQLSGETSANAVTHEWQERELSTRNHNAQPEGFTFTFTTAMTLPSRVSNVLQIFNKDIRVSETEVAIGHYGIGNMFADQMQIRMAELKTDVEHTMVQGTLASGSATDASRQMRGIIQAISAATNYTDMAGTSTMNETAFNDIFERAYDLGAEPRDVLVPGRMKRGISSFTASSTKYIASDEQRIVNTVSQYETDFGVAQIMLSRDVPTFGGGTSGYGVLAVDRTMVKKTFLRRVTAARVPQTADSFDGIVKTELTLEYGTANAHAYVRETRSAV